MSEKNIVWIVLDSIRADHTTIGGYERDTTPRLASIAAEPDGFSTTCTAHAIWSLPSMASMLSCSYPEQHRVGVDNEALHEDVPTVAERLSDAGWHTVGLSVNPYFSEGTGLDKGFDDFQNFSITDLVKEAGVTNVLQFIAKLRKFSGGFSTNKRKHSPDYLLRSVVEDRVDDIAGESDPFFLCAHFNGAHHPYNPAPHFRDQFADELSHSDAFESGYQNSTDIYKTIAEDYALSSDDWDAVTAMYDSLIRQTDELIYDLVQYIKSIDDDRETAIVITADHGDHLGEYGMISHKLTLHDGLLQVPLVATGTHPFDEATELVQHNDFIATLLEEQGISTDGFAGVDLRSETREYAVSQRGGITYDRTMEKVTGYNSDFELDYTSPGLFSAITNGPGSI